VARFRVRSLAWSTGHAMEAVVKSIVSYIGRGPFGDADYPGNCSGFLVRDLIRVLDAKSVCDPAEGSGTTGEACAASGVPCVGFDLRTGFDLEANALDAVLEAPVDLVFFHPPYFRIIQYSGNVWGTEPHPADLSHEQDWQQYLARLRKMVEHCLSGLTPKGHLAILIGDVRKEGSYYSAQAQILRWFNPDRVASVIIKEQHGVRSNGQEYAGRLIRIMHEYCIVVRAGGRHG